MDSKSKEALREYLLNAIREKEQELSFLRATFDYFEKGVIPPAFIPNSTPSATPAPVSSNILPVIPESETQPALEYKPAPINGALISTSSNSRIKKVDYQAIVDVINRHGRFLHKTEVEAVIQAEGFAEIRSNTLSAKLSTMFDNNVLARIKYGSSTNFIFYGLPKFIATDEHGVQYVPDAFLPHGGIAEGLDWSDRSKINLSKDSHLGKTDKKQSIFG